MANSLCDTYDVTISLMIKSFSHKGLDMFFRTGQKTGIQAAHARRLQIMLTMLNVAKAPQAMNAPGFGLHVPVSYTHLTLPTNREV